jgi:hypothetical protein
MKARNLLYTLLGVVVLISIGCGTASSATNSGTGDKHETLKSDRRGLVKEARTIQWRVARPPRGNLVQIFGVARWCVHYPKPRISRVDIRERRRAVFLRAFMTIFRRPGKYDDETCTALEVGMKKKVMFSSPLRDRALYDSGVSPPEKRWPRSPK